VLIALFSVRSENLFVEQLGYNLLYRWFLDMDLSEPVFDNSTFSKNQQRLMEHETAKVFFAQVVGLAREEGWVSDEHFSVDGTLIESWASLKSFVRKDGKDALYATNIAPEIDADVSDEYWTQIRKPARDQPRTPPVQTPDPRFRQKTFSMGSEQFFQWDKALGTADAIGDQEFLRELKKRLAADER